MNVCCRHTFKLEHTRTNKKTWSMIELYSNRDKHEHVPGDPRGTFGRALFNVKSRTLRALTMVSCWWRLNVVTMVIPLIFFHFFIEQDARTYTNSKTRYELRKRTYFGILTYLPHTWSLQNSKCMEFSVALVSIGIVCPLFFLIFP